MNQMNQMKTWLITVSRSPWTLKFKRRAADRTPASSLITMWILSLRSLWVLFKNSLFSAQMGTTTSNDATGKVPVPFDGFLQMVCQFWWIRKGAPCRRRKVAFHRCPSLYCAFDDRTVTSSCPPTAAPICLRDSMRDPMRGSVRAL